MLEFGLTVSPRCGVVIDSWHWHHAGSDPSTIRNMTEERILDLHIADSPAAPPEEIRDWERLLAGEGIVDFHSFLELPQEKNFREPLTVEIFGRGLSDTEPGVAAGLVFRGSTAMLEKIG